MSSYSDDWDDIDEYEEPSDEELQWSITQHLKRCTTEPDLCTNAAHTL